jgi:hypothetical protein
MRVRLKQPRAITPVKAELDALGIAEFVSLDEHRTAVAIMDAHKAQIFKGWNTTQNPNSSASAQMCHRADRHHEKLLENAC